jgi:hypothetical protein
MSLNYTKVFGDVGSLIARINSYGTEASVTLPADLTTLVTQFGTTWLPEEGIASSYEDFKADVVNRRTTLAGFVDQRLLFFDDVLSPLGLSSGSSIDDVLTALHEQFLLDSQTVAQCNCAAGAVTAPTTPQNHGNGTAFPTLVLDGYNAPLVTGPADITYNGLPSQLVVPSETMTLICTADSVQDGLSEGGEEWSWSGGPNFPPLDYHAEGSGPGPGLTTANVNSLAAGGDFESFSAAGVPAGWVIDSGTAGASIKQDTTTFFRGTSACVFTGDGTATLQLGQLIGNGGVQSARRYLLSIAVKASQTWAGGSVAVKFQSLSTGYVPGSGEQILVPSTAAPAGWTLYSGFINLPTPVPADWRLLIQVNELPVNAKVWVDSLCFTPVDYHGGVGLNVVTGSSAWRKGDRLTFTVTNDGAGKFQTFWRQWYSRQLPSAVAGTFGTALTLPFLLLTQVAGPTISDGLVV